MGCEMSKKWLWCRNGALIGLAIVLEDYFLEWRGQQYLPWGNAEAFAFNLAQMFIVIAIPALIGLFSGMGNDRRGKKVE